METATNLDNRKRILVFTKCLKLVCPVIKEIYFLHHFFFAKYKIIEAPRMMETLFPANSTSMCSTSIYVNLKMFIW